MSDSICHHLPQRSHRDLRTVHFVYEAEYHTLRQPFFYPIHYLFLVTNGTAEVRSETTSFCVERGSVYFFYPSSMYRVTASEDFRYLYISFTGDGVEACLSSLGVTEETAVYHGHGALIDFWFSCLAGLNENNAHLLSESVLLYTLSALAPSAGSVPENRGETLCRMMVDYVAHHYTDASLSLSRLSSFFCYTEKYLSALFVKHMKCGFRSYLATLRLEHAARLLATGEGTVTEVALACGYRDALYFSKAFKARYGCSPLAYMRAN